MISTIESLFRYGLRDFKGLHIENLWNDKTYNVVRLDFSEIKEFTTVEDFERKFKELIASKFHSLGFSLNESRLSWERQLADCLAAQPVRSLVLLIDEYDASFTACLDDKNRFDRIQSLLTEFYLKLKSNEGCLRFFFMTGITKFSNANLFSAINNLQDISLNPRYGTLLGYTEEEIRNDFAPYLEKAEASLGLTSDDLIKALQVHYDGFCFDDQASAHVFCPWAVLNFLMQPELGFRNY